jgi:hypothetical protein
MVPLVGARMRSSMRGEGLMTAAVSAPKRVLLSGPLAEHGPGSLRSCGYWVQPRCRRSVSCGCWLI